MAAHERLVEERWDYRVTDPEGRVLYEGQRHSDAVRAAEADGSRLRRRTYGLVESLGPWKDYEPPPAVREEGDEHGG